MSDTSSIKSGGSSRYRKVSASSSIDESLFGAKKSPISKSLNQHSYRNSRTNTTCINEIDLIAMKRRSVTPIQDKNYSGEAHEKQKSKVAKARKKRMLAMEAESIELQKQAFVDNISAAREKQIKESASDQIEQSADIVKLLNTYAQRAIAFTIRDQQLQDKSKRSEKEKIYEKRMEIAMEVGRLKDIAAREVEEGRKLQKRVEDRKVIIDQIEERQKTKILLEEARDQENQLMIATIKKYEEDTKVASKKKFEEAARIRSAIIEANEDAILKKKKYKEREKEEIEQILSYQAIQDEKMRAREAEETEAARKKKELQAKLLESQTRTQDKQAIIDEIRARRAMEETERRYREKELAEAKKRKQDMERLAQARAQQEAEKKERTKNEEKRRQEEYENTLKLELDMARREDEEASQQKLKNSNLRKSLKEQIVEMEDARRVGLKEKQVEGILIKNSWKVERLKLEGIRDKMVAEMRSKGINDKYLSEMMTIDIERLQMR